MALYILPEARCKIPSKNFALFDENRDYFLLFPLRNLEYRGNPTQPLFFEVEIMRTHIFLLIAAMAFFLSVESVQAQGPVQMITETAHRHHGFHAGIHSGSWTLKREQILEAESKDPHRGCDAPYCNRCSKHLADYGHEYQYLGGPSQRQLWYRGTAGSVAHVTQRCYDEHGLPYALRGRPGAVMSWEYRCYLNHAIREQVIARNAVAAEEAAEDRVGLLSELRDSALACFLESEEAWKQQEAEGICVSKVRALESFSPCMKTLGCSKTADGIVFPEGEMVLGGCEYCRAKALYLKNRAYLASVEKELASAIKDLDRKTARADEAVRIALLSKSDADKATRFKRIQHKPPKYKEVLAAQEAKKTD